MLSNIQNAFRKIYLKMKTSPYLSKIQAELVSSTPSIIPQKFVFKRMEYPQLNRFFFRYFNSKPIDGKINGKSLAFVIGFENVGKTEYIQKNIASVIAKKNRLKTSQTQIQKIQFQIHKSPESFQQQIQQKVFDNQHYIITYLNFKKIGTYNYLSFINALHDNIKSAILQKVLQFQEKSQMNQKLNKKKINLLNSQILKQIVLHSYAPQFIFIYAKDVIYSILQDKDPIFFSKQGKQKLQEFNQSILGKNWEYFFNEKYHELIQLISKFNSKSDIESSLIFFYSVFQRIEYQNRPKQYVDSWYQNGIQTSNYLFAILDFLNGLGKYCQKIENDYINADNQTKKQILHKINQSSNYILQGNHIDILLCLSNLQHLSCYQTKDKQFLTFLDHIICRNSRLSHIRKKFPIMIQIPNRVMLDDFIQLGKLDMGCPVIVEIPGYMRNLLKFSNLIQIFSTQFIQKLYPKLGSNPVTWDKAIQALAKGQNLQKILQGKAKYQQIQLRKLHAKVNRIFVYQDCLPKINRKLLKYDMSDALWILIKTKGMMLSLRSYYSVTLFKSPYYKALLQQNVLYHRFYNSHMELTTLTNLRQLMKIKRQMGKIPFQNKIIRLIMLPWMMKIDLKSHPSLQRDIHIRHQQGKQSIDAQLYVTYYGPQTAYDFIYPRSAYQTYITNELI